MATQKRVPRALTTSRLSEAEAGALRDAESRYLDWRCGPLGVPPVNTAALVELREAAVRTIRALDAIQSAGAINPTLSHVLTRLSDAAPALAADHLDDLMQTMATLARIAVACKVPRGTKADQSAYMWIGMAADRWQSAGMVATGTGRFAEALRAFEGDPRIPSVSPAQVRQAVAQWRAQGVLS